MDMEIYSVEDFCAAHVIGYLNEFEGPKDAMIAFCKTHSDRYNGFEMRDPGAFILFTGVEDLTESDADYYRKKDGVDDDNEDYSDEEFPDPPLGYGGKFEKFILANDLGPVTGSELRPNRLNHPNHIDKMWVWCPDFERLKAWWEPHRAQLSPARPTSW
jgi:hypothetical protein